MTKQIETYHCHLVSQVLLKQFTDKSGKVVVVEKNNGSEQYTETDETGFIIVPTDPFKKFESVWKKPERHMDGVIEKIKDGSIFHSLPHLKTLKRFIAMHYVRSYGFIFLLSELEEQAAQEIIEEINNSNLDFEKALGWFRTSSRPETPQMMKEYYEKVYAEIEKYNVEIIKTSEDYPFSLSDIPVLNYLIPENRLGLREGVGIQADAVMLPVSPHYVVSLTSRNQDSHVLETNQSGVRIINDLTKRNSLRQYYIQSENV